MYHIQYNTLKHETTGVAGIANDQMNQAVQNGVTIFQARKRKAGMYHVICYMLYVICYMLYVIYDM